MHSQPSMIVATKTRSLLVALAATVLFQGSAPASIQFSGLSGSLAATADFSLTGSTLMVTLSNTSSADVLVPGDVLMAVLFNTTSVLTPVSASLNGSTVYYASIVGNVGEGWEYKSGISAQGMNSGISGSGLGGTFDSASPNFFSPAQPPLDGVNYGILSAGDNSATGNGGVTGGGPLIKNSIEFTLTAAAGFSLSELGDKVVFQYGTNLTEPSFDGTVDGTVPEPASVVVWSSLVSCIGIVAIHRRNRADLA
jgi:hypothetical protein